MAARKKKRSTRKKPLYRVRSTRKGQKRITARRAYMRRSNPRGVLSSPAFKYGASAVGGAAASAILQDHINTVKAEVAVGTRESEGFWGLLSPSMGENGTTLHAGVIGGALTIGLAATLKMKANTKAMLVAAGVGMFAPAAVTYAQGLGSNPVRRISSRNVYARRPAVLSAPTSNVVTAHAFGRDMIPS